MTVAENTAAPGIFGLTISPLDAGGVADRVVGQIRAPADGVGLIVTPNIHHVTMLRSDRSFAAAYAGAEIVTCDGFPVLRYARWRGVPAPGRVTGCDIVSAIMRHAGLSASHRIFFVLDSAATEQAVQDWATQHGLASAIQTAVPAFGFENDAAYCRRLARQIADHGTTILFMGVGAPKSEIFVDRHRAMLPPCWALCIGQAVMMELGLTPRPPGWVIALNLEWLWRIFLEPKRLTGRYATAAFGFIAAIAADLRGRTGPR